MGHGPVLPRTMSSGRIKTCCGGISVPSRCPTKIPAASRPISAVGKLMVVRGGIASSLIESASNQMTEMSSGTRKSFARMAFNTPITQFSCGVTSAVMCGFSSSKRPSRSVVGAALSSTSLDAQHRRWDATQGHGSGSDHLRAGLCLAYRADAYSPAMRKITVTYSTSYSAL